MYQHFHNGINIYYMSLIKIFNGKVPFYDSKIWRIPPVFIYVGGSEFSKYEQSLLNVSKLWTVNYGASIEGIAVDKDGNVYTGGSRINNITTRKYDPSGSLIWSRDHGVSSVQSVAVDKDGNVYTGGNNAFVGQTTRKYNSSGTLLWSRNHGLSVQGIAVDKNGNVYTGAQQTNNLTTRKYDTSGNLLWSRNHGTNVMAISVDKDGNVYTGGFDINSITTRKYDTNGNLIWSVSHGSIVYTIAVDKDGNVYTGGSITTQVYADSNDGGQRVTTRKYDSSGNLIWSRGDGTQVISIVVDKDDNLYNSNFLVVNSQVTNPNVKKFDSFGNIIWSIDNLFARAIAVSINISVLPQFK
jgi:hypothetical protein